MTLFLILYGAILLYGALHLGIGPDEAKIVFSHPLYNLLYRIYPDELFVRLPNILLSIVNVVLFYNLAKRYLNRREDAFLSAAIFSLLPAVIGSAVVINKAPWIIFLTLLFLLLYYRESIYAYLLALIMLFVDNSFAVLFLAVTLYDFYRKSMEGFYFLGLFVASIALFGFDVGGKPKNYFLDTFAVFAAIFSPLLFLYFFYTIYRILVKERKDLLWFVSATAFLFSLLLSFRQRILLIDFAPFVVIGVILMVRTFKHSLRVRLKRYKKKLLIYFYFVIGTLLINDAILILNERLFLLFPSLTRYVHEFYEGRALAQALRKKGLHCIRTDKKKSLQLRFYGIGSCDERFLIDRNVTGAVALPIFYKNRLLGVYYVSNSNTMN